MHFHKDSQIRSTGNHPDIGNPQPRIKMDRLTRNQLKALVDEIAIKLPKGIVQHGEKFYMTPEEAAHDLGLDARRTQLATRLIRMVVEDVRGMYGIVTMAQEGGIPTEAIAPILRRGRQMIYRKEISKGRPLPVGTVRSQGGRQMVKRGEGKWVPVKGGSEGGDKEESAGKKASKIDPDLKRRYAGIKSKAKQHKVNIKGDLADHHTHDHMDQLESRLDEHVNGKKKSADRKSKKDRPSPESPQEKQGMQQEVGDLVGKLQGMSHRVDDDHKAVYDRLLKEGQAIAKDPSGSGIDWFESRVESFIHLATGKGAEGTGGVEKSSEPPGAVQESQEAEKQQDYKATRDNISKAAKKLKGLATESVTRIMHAVKHTAEEFPIALQAVGKVMDGEPLAPGDRKAMISVGVTLGTVALSASTAGAGAGAAAFGSKFLTHVATAAVHHHLATSYVGYAGLKLAEKTGYILDLIKAKEEAAKPVKEGEDGDDEMPKEMVEFAHGVLDSLQKLLDREWSDDEIDVVSAEGEEGEEEIAKKAVYFDLKSGELVLGSQVLQKAKQNAIMRKALKAGHKIIVPEKKKTELVIEKAQAHKYKKRWKVGGKWQYEYDDDGPGKPHHQEQLADYKLTIVSRDPRRAKDIAARMKQGIGKAADICKITPPVCEGNMGISRSNMPQIMDVSVKQMLRGNESDRKKAKAAVAMGADATSDKSIKDLLLDKLKDRGVKVDETEISVGSLKATQREIKAGKTYGMADAYLKGKFDPADEQIIVSSDNHILDGHHRWAALIVADPSMKMKVIQVDLTMKDFLKESFKMEGVFRADLQGDIVDPSTPLNIGKSKLVIAQPGRGKDAAIPMREYYNQLQPLVKAGRLFVQLIDDEITVSGDLSKAGVPSYLLPHEGAHSVTLGSIEAADLVKALEAR